MAACHHEPQDQVVTQGMLMWTLDAEGRKRQGLCLHHMTSVTGDIGPLAIPRLAPRNDWERAAAPAACRQSRSLSGSPAPPSAPRRSSPVWACPSTLPCAGYRPPSDNGDTRTEHLHHTWSRSARDTARGWRSSSSSPGTASCSQGGVHTADGRSWDSLGGHSGVLLQAPNKQNIRSPTLL